MCEVFLLLEAKGVCCVVVVLFSSIAPNICGRVDLPKCGLWDVVSICVPSVEQSVRWLYSRGGKKRYPNRYNMLSLILNTFLVITCSVHASEAMSLPPSVDETLANVTGTSAITSTCEQVKLFLSQQNVHAEIVSSPRTGQLAIFSFFTEKYLYCRLIYKSWHENIL